MVDLKESDFYLISYDLVQFLQRKSNLTLLLESIVDDQSELKRISKDSFIHNLGFTRINLIGWDTSEYMVKLHVWNLFEEGVERNQIMKETIHDHMYDFRSGLIKGQMKFTIFSEDPTGNIYTKYESPISDKKYIFNNIGNVGLVELIQVSLEENSTYFIRSETIHNTSIKDDFTVTICIQSKLKKKSTFLYIGDGKIIDKEKSKRFDQGELKNVIKKVIEKL